ncbi:MAG: serpin family protein [Chloroflexota bacterium]|nr:serpin family protein [Chloroflexota bacterium]MDE2930936.1 serpin family protein [Chloroflexota bacterium]
MYESITGLNGLWRSVGSAVLVTVLWVTATVFLTTCGDASSGELRSTKERAAPTSTDAALVDLAKDNSAFAFDLYRALRVEEGNLFYSPYSISLALAMTYAGASGQTESQMAETLYFTLSQEKLHSTFNALALELASRGEGGQVKKGQEFRLNVVNAVWGQQDHEFREAFLDILAESYGAGVRPADFVAAPEESRLTINDWVADNTEDRIKDLIPPDVIDPLTRMVLTNAIYFKAAWAFPFDAANTRDHPFYLLDGSSVDVPMMSSEEEFSYAAGDGYQVVDLPYAGFALSMIIMLPDKGQFAAFEASLDAALVDRIVANFGERLVELDLPKFTYESQFRLGETLRSMGMSDAFASDAADFSGMDGKSCLAGDPECLYIREVVHKAFVSVDEKGTEAAAATAVVMQTESAPPPRVKVTVDRPFIFLIRDRATGSILFVGRVTHP